MQAQSPVHWTFSAKKMADKDYEITLTATVNSPWHIYSQHTPDGGPVATKISFNPNPLVKLDDDAKEVGELIKKREDVFDMDVKYFNGNVAFVQKVKMKANAKTKISGTVEFMVCNDTQCLPPTKVPFSIDLK